jgi:hypothetical protein
MDESVSYIKGMFLKTETLFTISITKGKEHVMGYCKIHVKAAN